ncbi:MAG: UvrD-helicase domain-containing protein [Verrucomicrobia bacterium]|nr:UvrD-helicase domain-containing protein [Verrucomicrobiota bacterium]
MSRDYVLQPHRPAAELHIDYARELNPQQLAAVTAPPGPALVIAGAGSGKTRTLTYRVAYLLETGIPADRILLLTFTNKAAKEMMHRVSDLLGRPMPQLWGGTFHSIGNRILRRHADTLGFTRSFTILDREDANDLIKASLADAEIDVKAMHFPKAEVLADIFSMAANTERTVPALLEKSYDHFAELGPRIADVAARYVKRKRAANAMDFDDLLALWLRLMREHDDVRELYQRRFQFILVDEYQDTNALQGELIDLLAARHKNVTVVGDDAQSIYAWRGANYKNILEFPKRYAGAAVHKIETNYRSTPEILNVANAAIAANIHQFTKQLTPARKSGEKPALVVCGDGQQQAAFVAQRALELREQGRSLNEMAVLYRSHFHALELQLELTRRQIPFSITSGIRFFEQAHVKDVAAWLKFVVNPRDELSFRRLAQLLPGIGGKGAEKLWSAFGAECGARNVEWQTAPPVEEVNPDDPDWSVTEVPAPDPESRVQNPESAPRPRLAPLLQACARFAPKKSSVAWVQFVATISQLEAEPVRGDTAAMIELVLEAGYEDYLKETYANFKQRLEDLQQLGSFARQFKSLEEFLTQLALLTNVEAEDQQAAPEDDERLKLSTIHQAKGLEFGVVFVIMLCDGLFPSARALGEDGDLEGEEEERRLFYVAITRAKDELYLIAPESRMTGQAGFEMLLPSRFLNEIPDELVEEIKVSYGSLY